MTPTREELRAKLECLWHTARAGYLGQRPGFHDYWVHSASDDTGDRLIAELLASLDPERAAAAERVAEATIRFQDVAAAYQEARAVEELDRLSSAQDVAETEMDATIAAYRALTQPQESDNAEG